MRRARTRFGVISCIISVGGGTKGIINRGSLAKPLKSQEHHHLCDWHRLVTLLTSQWQGRWNDVFTGDPAGLVSYFCAMYLVSGRGLVSSTF